MFHQREQKDQDTKMEISGFKDTKVDENQFVAKVMQAAGLNEEDIQFRVEKIVKEPMDKKGVRTQTLVVQFRTEATRNDVLAKIKSGKVYNKLGDIVPTKIFFNEYLTAYYKKLLYEAKRVKEEKKYAFLWVKSGKILLKKTKDSKIEALLCNDDLLIHVNINSLKAKWDELCIKLQSVLPYLDVLIFTEIDVNSEKAVCYQLEKFHQISKCRVSKGGGGGVMVFYRDDFEMENLCYNIDQADNIAVRLTHQVHKTNWLILAIYRSPKLVLNSFLEDVNFWLTNATKKTDNVIMIGDINICLKKKSTCVRYVNMLNNHTLVPLIQEYTREEVLAGNVTKSCIDHINVRMKREYNYSSSVITDKVADHYFVALRVSKIGAQIPSTKIGPVYKEISDNKLIQQKIEAIDWASLKDECMENPQQLYEEITNKFNNIYETSKKTIQVRDNKYHTPWVNQRVKNEIELKRRLLRTWQNNKNNLFNLERYKKQRNLVTNLIKKQKRIYTYKVFKEASGNMKQTWSLINNMMDRKKKDPIEDVLKKNFQTNDLLTLSNQFNKKFIDQIVNIKLNNQGPEMSVSMNDFVPQSCYSTMYLRKARMADINLILKNMKKTGKGIDGIRSGDIINNKTIFIPIITHLVNLMIDQSHIPDGLKISCVSPLFKNKGKVDDMSNYRPVGSMPLIEKVLEKHINIQMKKYLAENEILPDFQHGFQSGKSTTTLLQDFADLVNTALDERKCVVILLLDLSFAFDALEHSLLLEKFKQI
ncbi:uncharacterized protein LOC103522538, partial [Diaphorina citri]|uniref:Uncharacterized protein LOC103522538 n=1 Tax=Diaphorina citri TaxID=121845 RepID=A0A1S3DRB6_DIACI